MLVGLYIVPSVHISKVKEDLNYHLAKHHAPQDKKLITLCAICLEEFPSFYSLQQYKRRQQGTSLKVGTKSSERLKKKLESKELYENNKKLQQELSACKNFFDNTKMENVRHREFMFRLSKLDLSKINEKLSEMFENSNCAAKIHLALGIFY